jgi:hypothetical protein
MTITALIAEARRDLLNDYIEPYRWSDEQLTRFANEAVTEACNRIELIHKTRTVAVVAGTAQYTIDQYVQKIFYANLALATEPLTQVTAASLDIFSGYGWRNRTGAPRNYIREGRTLTLFPKPVVNDTLTFKCTSIPDDTFDIDVDIEAADQKGLIYWIAYKAFLFPDPSTFNSLKAIDYFSIFNSIYGNPKSTKYLHAIQNNPMYGTIIGGRMC